VKPEDERLFFEHDIATPLTNALGAAYLLRAGADPADEGSREALEILGANLRTLERMVGWYWRVRQVTGLEPVPPYEAGSVGAAVAERIREEALPLAPPDGGWGAGRATVPEAPLVTGLLGAGLTLAAASGRSVAWRVEAGEGVVWSLWSVPGEQGALDAGRLFRKVYWPGGAVVKAWTDPGLPYLEAVLEPAGGSLELVWADGRWELRAAIPVVP
jgi:hypothetical protein